MNYISGDLLEQAKNNHFDVIIHGCNCFNTMGAGIAKAIKSEFPEAFEVDQKTKKGDREKLGTITVAQHGNLFIVNAYTQYEFSRTKKPFDYDAFHSCLRLIKGRFSGKRIGLPKIGAGLAGGDWVLIEKILKEELGNEDVTVVIKD